jgi:hypothetical protein
MFTTSLGRINSKMARLLIFFSLSLFLPAMALCQVDTGSISGTVRDTSGSVISGVNVTLINQGTGQSISTTSKSAGEYTFSPVRIGRYSVSAEMTGFEKIQQNNVTVDVQQKVQVDLLMTLGKTSETVTVDAAPPALQTQDASVGQVIGQQAINDLPLNGRNYTFLAQLAAGVNQGQQDTRAWAAADLSRRTDCVRRKTTTCSTGSTTTPTWWIFSTGRIMPLSLRWMRFRNSKSPPTITARIRAVPPAQF